MILGTGIKTCISCSDGRNEEVFRTMAWQRKKSEIWENIRQLFVLHTLPPEHTIWTHLIYLFTSSTYIKQVRGRCKALKAAAKLPLRVPSSVALTEQSVAPPLPLYRTVTTVKHSTEKPILTTLVFLWSRKKRENSAGWKRRHSSPPGKVAPRLQNANNSRAWAAGQWTGVSPNIATINSVSFKVKLPSPSPFLAHSPWSWNFNCSTIEHFVCRFRAELAWLCFPCPEQKGLDRGRDSVYQVCVLFGELSIELEHSALNHLLCHNKHPQD